MKFPWEKENKGNEGIQWENEIEIPDQDLSKAHGQHILSQRRKLTTTTLTRTTVNDGQRPPLQRRLSHDNDGKTFTFIIDVEKTKKELLEQEDTDKNYQITIQDKGPKIFKLGTFNSEGFKSFEIRGTYQLSNLLQELELASSYGRSTIILDSKRLNENPLERLNRLIKYHFWDSLTRRMDHLGLEKIIQDPKNRQNDHSNRIYIPNKDDFGWDYYSRIAATNPHLGLCLERLPLDITPEYVKSINDKPGILSLALRHMVDQNSVEYIRGVPFVVPGGRFNEMYGWDSYFESLGLLADGRIELARGMVENFWYEIERKF
jgi:alpha,alpha-trehalase